MNGAVSGGYVGFLTGLIILGYLADGTNLTIIKRQYAGKHHRDKTLNC